MVFFNGLILWFNISFPLWNFKFAMLPIWAEWFAPKILIFPPKLTELFIFLLFQVISVEQVIDRSDEVADLEFQKLEEKLGDKSKKAEWFSLSQE